MRNVEQKTDDRNGITTTLDTLAREGARQMIALALDAEVEDYVRVHARARDANGRALVVRNGYAQERTVILGSGAMSVAAPRVNDKRVVDGERQQFRSVILPPYVRRSASISELLPILYLHGLSTGDFRDALTALVGENAAGLSPSTITRLTSAWVQEQQSWQKRSLVDTDYIYVWVDGIHFNVRLEDDRIAALVMIGVRIDGSKEVIAFEGGYRESTESWLSLLRNVKSRGMKAPVLAVGDGALGFWAALGQVFPETKEQRCWVHKLVNILDKLPKSVQPTAKSMLHEVMMAPTRAKADKAIEAFSDAYKDKYPKAVACLQDDASELLTFMDFPAAHWSHLRSTNPIESTFATVRHRTRVTKGAGSRTAGLAMVFKLLQLAEKSWRRINGFELLQPVRDGVKFPDGFVAATKTKPNPKGLKKTKSSTTTKTTDQQVAA